MAFSCDNFKKLKCYKISRKKVTEVPAHLREKGRAVVSGFSTHQMRGMEDFYAALGLETMERETHDEWGCLVLRKIRLAPAR
jgi:ribosomal protein L11 methylase PrmA